MPPGAGRAGPGWARPPWDGGRRSVCFRENKEAAVTPIPSGPCIRKVHSQFSPPKHSTRKHPFLRPGKGRCELHFIFSRTNTRLQMKTESWNFRVEGEQISWVLGAACIVALFCILELRMLPQNKTLAYKSFTNGHVLRAWLTMPQVQACGFCASFPDLKTL